MVGVGTGVMMDDDGNKRPRSVMASDREWSMVRSRARSAGMSASAFVLERALAPAVAEPERDDLPLAVRRRAVVDQRVLVSAERLRFEQEGLGGIWRRLAEEAEASLAADEREG
ncbi:MAG: hypothetical protein OXE57_12575 [Alphaproteobacteria bacterium]|nr:hypothetical protein [Alphaproteobacteria bacterium]